MFTSLVHVCTRQLRQREEYSLSNATMALIWLGIVLLFASSFPGEARRKFNRGRKNVCERITIPECASLGYQWTKFPNPFTNISSQAATNNLTRFLPVLAQLNCTKTSALPFLCSVYVPLCIPGSKKQFTPPCREFCARSVGSCPALAQRYGIQWPSTLDCSNYPSKSEAGKCMPMLKIRRKQKNSGEKFVYYDIYFSADIDSLV